MNLSDIYVGGKATFRTLKMAPNAPDHVGVVKAFLDSVKGAWVELEMADGGTYRTRPALVKSCTKPKSK